MGFLDKLLGRGKPATTDTADTHAHDHDHEHEHEHEHEQPAPGTTMPEAGAPGEEPATGGPMTPP
jgi:hypothetical protein